MPNLPAKLIKQLKLEVDGRPDIRSTVDTLLHLIDVTLVQEPLDPPPLVVVEVQVQCALGVLGRVGGEELVQLAAFAVVRLGVG